MDQIWDQRDNVNPDQMREFSDPLLRAALERPMFPIELLLVWVPELSRASILYFLEINRFVRDV